MWEHRKDAEIEMVEVTDGRDSRGGFNSDGENIYVGYGLAVMALRRAAFGVVPNMEDYF